MKGIGKGLIIVLAIVVVIVVVLVSMYNGLVRSDENVNEAWGVVQSSYQRRADLIPNLVETVKGYAKHESETLTELTKMRSRYSDAKTPSELQSVDADFARNINIVVENYPDLKANQNFLALQDQLEGTENRINTARNDYNTAVKSFNQKVRSFPTNIFAGMLGFERRDMFEAQPGSENAPNVSF